MTRVTTMGELVASIAHEVNQPLTAVVMNANAGMRWLAGESPNPTKHAMRWAASSRKALARARVDQGDSRAGEEGSIAQGFGAGE